MALMVASGFPGCRAVAKAWVSRSIAACSPADSSVIVRDTSVAVSMARSAVPGWGIVSVLTVACPLKLATPNETATFGYPRVRSF